MKGLKEVAKDLKKIVKENPERKTNKERNSQKISAGAKTILQKTKHICSLHPAYCVLTHARPLKISSMTT